METQKFLNRKSNMKTKNRAGGIRVTDSRLYYKAIIIKTVWYWHRKKNLDQGTRQKTINKSIHIWSGNLCQKKQDYTMLK